MTTRTVGASAPAFSPLDFFRHLFSGDEPGYVCLWTRQDMTSHWFGAEEIEAAAKHAVALSKMQRLDVYVGVAKQKADLGKGRRGKRADVAGIRAYWADLDVGAKNGKRYFPSKQEALAWLLNDLPYIPSIIIDSGSGYHAYWLLEEDATQEDGIADGVAAWGEFLRSRTDYDIDSVFDLARVMRVPGTENWKDSRNPVPVTVVRATGETYSKADLDEYGIHKPREDTPDAADVSFNMEEQPQPPFDKHEALLENDQKFAATWKRARTDLNDTTPSGYCMSLANFCAAAGYSDQEIVDTLRAWRKKHSSGEKPVGWYARTIVMARKESRREARIRKLTSPTADTDDPLESISDILMADVESVTRYEPRQVNGYRENASYRVALKNGMNIRVKDTRSLIDQYAFRVLYAEQAQIVLAPLKAPAWHRFAELMIRASNVVEESVEGTVVGIVGHLLGKFLASATKVDRLEEVMTNDTHVLVLDGDTYVHWHGFMQWTKFRSDSKLAHRDVQFSFKALGAERRIWNNVMIDGKRTNVRLWKIPDGIDEVVG